MKYRLHGRLGLYLGICVAFGFGLGGCGASSDGSPDGRNQPPKVFVVVLDSLRYDHLNSYGYDRETAPFLATLAQEGVDFSRAYAPSNYTPMSVSSLFLGKPPSHVFDPHPDNIRIPDDEITMAESFRNEGYETYLWSSNLHLRRNGINAGFVNQFCDYLQTRGIVSIEGMIREMQLKYAPSGKPEFHYIHTMDIHVPYRPPHPYERMYRGGRTYPGTVSNTGAPVDDLGEYIFSNAPYFSETHRIKREDIDFLIDLYDAAIRYTDDHLPEMLRTLGYDPERDTLVITADHGEQFYEHQNWSHNRMLLPQETHVPLILKSPGLQARTVSGPASLLDLYPTFCAMFGLERPEGLTGTDLSAALRGEGEVNGTVYMEQIDQAGYGAAIVNSEGYFYYLRGNMIVMSPWATWPFDGRLYDLNADPACRTNLFSTESAIARRLHEELIRANGRWASYDFEMIEDHDGRVVEAGPNTLRTGMAAHVVEGFQGVAPELLATEGILLNAVHPLYRVTADVHEPGHPYMLTFEYSVEKPNARFELWGPDDTGLLWEYPITRASDGPINFRMTRVIDHPYVNLVIKVEDGGNIRVRDIQFRRLGLPETKPVPGPTVYNESELPQAEGDQLSPEEREALEAIGYVQ